MPEPIAYLNGQYIPNSNCVLPIYDGGIVLGAAITDMLRTFNGKPFAAGEHARRFLESAKYAYLNLGLSESDLLEIVERLISHNLTAWPGRELSLVFYATVGEFPVYAGAAGMAGERRPTVCLHCFPFPFSLWKEALSIGVHAVTPTQRHVHPNILSSKIKHRNRLHMWIGDQQAKLVDPKAVGLFLDLDGNVSETGGANFVIFKNGEVISPRRNNILWGVSLDTLQRISGGLGWKFLERDLQLHDVVNADEAWLCSTPFFLAPVVKVNGLTIGNGQPGSAWRRAIDTFSAEVGVDVVRQILDSPS